MWHTSLTSSQVGAGGTALGMTARSGRRRVDWLARQGGVLRRTVHLAIACGVILSIAWLPLSAATIVVTQAGDGGAGSLRDAILNANAQASSGNCPEQTINFAIPGAGVHTIRPLSELPAFKIPIRLNGYSQPGAAVNTLSVGTDAKVLIELDGSLAGGASGIVLEARVSDADRCSGSGSEISGLAINRFADAGIVVDADACGSRMLCSLGNIGIWGNFIGTDPTGTVALGNGRGVVMGTRTLGTIIGALVPDGGGFDSPQPVVRNVISGNIGAGIYTYSSQRTVVDGSSIQHSVRGNLIGVNAAATAALPNGGDGILADTGTLGLRVRHNVISGNTGNGVNVFGIEQNAASIHANAIGIGAAAIALGNGGHGVRVSGDLVRASVGGSFPGIDPTTKASIAHNSGAGVSIEGNAVVDVSAASIADNGGLEIDLAPEGVNPIDDVNSGPNGGLDYPVIVRAALDPASGKTLVEGTLHAPPLTTIDFDFYLNDQCDPSGFGGAQRYLSVAQIPAVHVTTDAAGNAQFSRLATVAFPPGKFLTAVSRRFSRASGVSTLEVSELSACRRIEGADSIFVNGFEAP